MNKIVKKAVEKTDSLSLGFEEKRKNPVSKPKVKKTNKKPKYAYISVTTPYSSGRKTRVYKTTKM